MEKKSKPPFSIVIILCLTLGLAPFVPEPHVWGKLKWIVGGAHGMEFVDWFDFLMHGAPWMALIFLLVKTAFKKTSDPKV